ncbi:RNA 2',3'-cyclic phosphodiesterase [Flexilinea flocculi]|jgi:2'-5' RNA ligase|uniref:RNA 2',3'-cyclic phosphodiesterase n=1 Tax=Flexilinea flocculi TaxID=1678840 RepID=A0A0S7BSQ6_9CHLR|nr:RNA 2',3'-cyclic phosphodiesterase [Flexilinea flocculi]GAP41547.1 2'-5' RNA ligase [Flexilinea flocculi]
MPRLFIAVPISKTSKEIIVKNVLQNPVVKMPDIRWISENNLHITLKFLGEVPIRKVQLLKEIVQKSGLSHDSFKIQLKDSGVFPNKRTPRVLWIGIQPPDALCRLQNDLEKLAFDQGFEKENRPFQPHLTLGRLSDNGHEIAIESLDTVIQTVKEIHFPPFVVDQIQLIESTLTPQGPLYHTIYSQNLKNMLISVQNN